MQPFLFRLFKVQGSRFKVQGSRFKVQIKDSMIKRIAWGIVFLFLSVLTLGYVFRMPITQWAIASSLSQSGVELHCLDWSLNSNISLEVNRLCLAYQGHQIELGDIVADTKKITVGRANLRLNDSESVSASNNSFKKLALNLPKQRPKIDIKRLLITHPQLHDELVFSIGEEKLNTFVISGDAIAEITVSNHKVTGHFKVADGILTKIKPMPALSLNSEHDFIFDGLSVDIKSNIDADFTQQFSKCPVTLSAFGNMNMYYHFNDKKALLNAQQLSSLVTFDSDCLALINNQSQREFIAKQLPLKWQLMLSDAVKFENGQLVMPSMLLNTKNSQTKLSLKNLAINVQQPLEYAKGNIKLLFISEGIKHIEIEAALNNLAVDGNYQLNVDELPDFLSASAKKVASTGQFQIENVLQRQQNAKITSEMTFAELKFDKLTVKGYKAQFSAELDDKQNINASLNSQLRSVAYEQYQVRGVNNQLSAFSSLAVVSNIVGNFSVENSIARAERITADVLGGRFALDSYKVTEKAQRSLATFENIDASKLITLDDKSGITLTGRVNGRLPVYIDQQGISVKSGELSNQGTGKLVITDNAAFDAVKAQQQELGPILSLLEDLDIQSLNSSVDLKPDGWLYLGVNLKGYNKEQAQQVNFNYNHEENVFTLLRALRLSDEITQKVEQEYSTKGTKND